MNEKNISTLNELIERAGTRKDISITIFITGDTTHISIYPHPDPENATKNPVAEAYKSLLAGDTDAAIGYLGEALE